MSHRAPLRVLLLVTGLLCASTVAQGQSASVVPLKPGSTVRLATRSGQVVCRAMVHHADSAGLQLIDGSLSPPAIPWSDVQWLWTEERRVVADEGVPWSLVATGVTIVGLAATVVVGQQLEGFAPIGLVGVSAVVMSLVSLSLVTFGPTPPPGATIERAEWRLLPLPAREGRTTMAQYQVTRECGR
jgi:hypothetical protein